MVVAGVILPRMYCFVLIPTDIDFQYEIDILAFPLSSCQLRHVSFASPLSLSEQYYRRLLSNDCVIHSLFFSANILSVKMLHKLAKE